MLRPQWATLCILPHPGGSKRHFCIVVVHAAGHGTYIALYCTVNLLMQDTCTSTPVQTPCPWGGGRNLQESYRQWPKIHLPKLILVHLYVRIIVLLCSCAVHGRLFQILTSDFYQTFIFYFLAFYVKQGLIWNSQTEEQEWWPSFPESLPTTTSSPSEIKLHGILQHTQFLGGFLWDDGKK